MTKNKITLEIQKVHKVRCLPLTSILEHDIKGEEGTENALAAKIVFYRRALRSHSELLTKITNKFLEAQDIAVRLKGVIEEERDIGGACNLHFNMLRVLYEE